MTSEPITALYSHAVAVRPDAAVPGLSPPRSFQGWEYTHSQINESIATAIIGWHWLGLLVDGARLERSLHTGRWLVEWNHESSLTDSYSTPIEALAEYVTSPMTPTKEGAD